MTITIVGVIFSFPLLPFSVIGGKPGNTVLSYSCLYNYKFYTSLMKKSITQESDYGCGVACFAFVLGVSYKQAVATLGREQTVKHGWRPSDLVKALNDKEYRYENRYVRKRASNETYTNGTIVLIERSETYRVGHYLVRHDGKWMDPWINMPQDAAIANARSGFRDRLPGNAMYALLPISS